jgi:hypothetical protein
LYPGQGFQPGFGGKSILDFIRLEIDNNTKYT